VWTVGFEDGPTEKRTLVAVQLQAAPDQALPTLRQALGGHQTRHRRKGWKNRLQTASNQLRNVAPQ
jgi:hypothetical protein